MHPMAKINPGKRKINDTTPWPKSLDTICFHGLAHEEFDGKIMYVGDRIILCVIGFGP
jgi:hypothetical protein